MRGERMSEMAKVVGLTVDLRAVTAPFTPRSTAKLLTVAMLGLTVANCSSQPHSGVKGSIDPKYGVSASPRVVADGEAVPKGGGRAMVGRPYQIAGKTYVPFEKSSGYSREGLASWYGPSFHGRRTANGEVFDRNSISAAHPTMPLPSYARVTNLQNSRSIVVRVNDRGPFHGNRLLDVSQGVAEALDFRRAGTARVRLDYLAKASTQGSDDRTLLASLRTDGRLAQLPGNTVPTSTMVAGLSPAPRVSNALVVAQNAAPAPVAAEAVAPRPQAPAGRVFASVPLPPERPFDIGQGKKPSLQAQTPRGTRVASLFFAPDETGAQRFAKMDPFRELQTHNSLALVQRP
jgi:rare lipoprotein A